MARNDTDAALEHRPSAVDVYLTVDVEVWCDGWNDLDRKFPACFREYIYGPTARGDYGLPHQIDVLRDHGLTGVFFVEPLFSLRFSAQPLADIVGLLQAGRQDIQLHLHSEWVDEVQSDLLPTVESKRQYMRMFDADAQAQLLLAGMGLLRQAGAPTSRAFRAGGFGFDHRTLAALSRSGIGIDGSYNATLHGPSSGVRPDELLTDSTLCGGICELPMTVFIDGTRRLRHLQLTACSWAETEALLWQALERRQRSVTILWHGSELLDRSRRRPDDVVVRRFHKLCAFLARHREQFRVRTLKSGQPRAEQRQPRPLDGSFGPTALRIMEQIWRRRYAWTSG